MARNKKRRPQAQFAPARSGTGLSNLEWLPWATPIGVSMAIAEILSSDSPCRSVHALVDSAHRLATSLDMPLRAGQRAAWADRNARILELWGAAGIDDIVLTMASAGFLRQDPDGSFSVDDSVGLDSMLRASNPTYQQTALLELRLEW